ncbi:chromosome condensation protein [Billgrantia azerbaijanica]|nr:chromosome condensation protein [Halomonas azerbaijanica]
MDYVDESLDATGSRERGRPAGEHEQRMWLLQQQYPEAVHAHALTYRLVGRPDVDPLNAAVQEALRAPELNVRYRFGEDGVLRRLSAEGAADGPSLTCMSVESTSEAMEALVRRQERPWDLAEEAPLRCCLLLTPDAAILGLIVNRVIDMTASAAWLQRFASFVQGEGAAPGGFGSALSGWSQQETETDVSAPYQEAVAGRDTAVGGSEILDLLLEAFRQALDAPDMTADDDFFDLGGHSLIATRIIGRLLSEQGIEVHLNDLFSYPTAAALAEHARHLPRAEGQEQGGAVVRSEMHRVPLSLAQRSLWKVYAAFGFNQIFNIPFALRFLDCVDEAAFKHAFLDLLERHPGLRTLFHQHDGQVWQEVVPFDEVLRYEWFWYSHESRGVPLKAEASHRFDLARELPLRIRFLIDEETGEQIVSLLFHHIVLDEWSVNLMMEELEQAYRDRVAGNQPAWRQQPLPFHEFALRQHAAGVNQAHLDYWTERLRGAPPPKPLRADSATARGAGELASSAGGWVEFKLERDVAAGLYGLAKRNGASLFNVVYAAIAASIQHLGALDEIVIGTSASGRTDADFFDTIGYFTTVVAHRIGFPETMTLAGLITQVKHTINESMPHADIPIDLVEEALATGTERGRDRMFEVFIQLHAKNKLNGAFTLRDGKRLEFRQIDPEKDESLLGLQFEVLEEVVEGENDVRVMMSYRADHYGPEQVERIKQSVDETFTRFARVTDAEIPLASLQGLGSTLTLESHDRWR